MGYALCMGDCCICGRMFGFNPHKVPSMRLDKNGKPDDSAPRAPVCRSCLDKWNEARVKVGMEAIPALPGAYEAMPEEEL